MSQRQQKNLYLPKQAHPLAWLLSSTTVGVLGAAGCALIPQFSKKLTLLKGITIPGVQGALDVVPKQAYQAVLGFILGYGTGKCIDWLRWKALRKAFAYQGWIHNARSMKAKLWALSIQILRGPGPHSTFYYQDVLPNLPLPDLDETLDGWLKVAKNLLSEEEFELTKEAVEDFRNNEGPKVQEYLREKYRKEDNYIHDYWLYGAYLSSRESLMINSNYLMTNRIPSQYCTNQIARAATNCKILLDFQYLLETDQLPPILLQNLVPLCMDGYRNVYNSARIPGEQMDALVRYPGNKHIIVIRKGKYYRLDAYVKDGRGKDRMLSTEELKNQLAAIVEMADAEKGDECHVAALTSQRRNIWAKDREILMQKNKDTLHQLESAMFIINMEDFSPQDVEAQGKCILAGQGDNRWFDKCFSLVIYEDGSRMGFNVEHTAIDAMVFGIVTEYMASNDKYKDNDIISDTKRPPRKLPIPAKLTWDTSDLIEKIIEATKGFNSMAEDIETYSVTPSYGKGFMKKCRVSPDGYIQMALQLAQYRITKRIVKTYEPSTARMFLLGRTETVHPISESSVAFVKAIDDPTVSNEETKNHLRKAIKYQTESRLNATIGKGSDRHLLALLCGSRELGMDMPKIFMDKAWTLPFILSTSQTPNMLWEGGAHLVYEDCNGGFGPSCHDGYGICYIHIGDDILNINISNWKSSSTSNGAELKKQIQKAFDDMKLLFSS